MRYEYICRRRFCVDAREMSVRKGSDPLVVDFRRRAKLRTLGLSSEEAQDMLVSPTMAPVARE